MHDEVLRRSVFCSASSRGEKHLSIHADGGSDGATRRLSWTRLNKREKASSADGMKDDDPGQAKNKRERGKEERQTDKDRQSWKGEMGVEEIMVFFHPNHQRKEKKMISLIWENRHKGIHSNRHWRSIPPTFARNINKEIDTKSDRWDCLVEVFPASKEKRMEDPTFKRVQSAKLNSKPTQTAISLLKRTATLMEVWWINKQATDECKMNQS